MKRAINLTIGIFENKIITYYTFLLTCFFIVFSVCANAQISPLDSTGTTVFDKVMRKKSGYTCLKYLRKINQDSHLKYGRSANLITVLDSYSNSFPEVYINDNLIFYYTPRELRNFKKVKCYSYKIDPLIPRNGKYLLIKQLKFDAK